MTLERRCDSDNSVVPGEAAKLHSGALSAGRGDSHRLFMWRAFGAGVPGARFLNL